MRILNLIGAFFAILLFLGCGGGANAGSDTHQGISRELAGHMRDLGAIFQTINDVASAKEAAPRIEATRAKMRATAARAGALPKMSAAETAATEAAADTELISAMEAIAPARTKLAALMRANPQVKEIIDAATQGMENDMRVMSPN